MPNNTSSAGMLVQGTTVTLGGTTLANVFSTPDMGSDPERVDVTNVTDTSGKKLYIAGLQDVQNLNFDFYPTGTLPADANNQSCTIAYPNGQSHTFTADVRYFMLATSPGEPLKARASCVVSSWGSSQSGGGGT